MFYKNTFINSPVFKTTIILFITILVFFKSITQMLDLRHAPAVDFMNGHLQWSLALAINAATCHKTGYVSRLSIPSVEKMFYNNGASINQPLQNVFIQSSGASSVKNYCESLTTPFVNSENTLGWIIQGLFKINPKISLQNVANAFFVLQIFMLWFFFTYLSSIKVPSFYIMVLFIVSLSTECLQMPQHVLGQYPMLLPFTLFIIALLGFNLKYEFHKKNFNNIVFSILVGITIFYINNLRTSYSVVSLIILSTYLLVLFSTINKTSKQNSMKGVLQLFIIMVAYIACYVFIQKPLIPLEYNKRNSPNLTYHTAMHPLVLSLAIPSNKLATEQGIEWNDPVGLTIAKRVDPNVTYLSPNYDLALLKYYKYLWFTYPKEMINLYYQKFKSAKGHLAEPLSYFSYPLELLNGFQILLIQIILLGALFYKKHRLNTSQFFCGLCLSLVGAALYAESGIVFSFFVPSYHAYLTFWLTLLNLLIWYGLIRLTFYFASKLNLHNVYDASSLLQKH